MYNDGCWQKLIVCQDQCYETHKFDVVGTDYALCYDHCDEVYYRCQEEE